MIRRALCLIFLAGLLLWPGAVQARRPQSAPPAPVALPGGEAQGTAPLPTPQDARAAAGRAGGEVAEYRLPEAGRERSRVGDGARMPPSLAAVLLILGVGVKAVRRWPGLVGRETSAGPLELLGRLPLTAKEALCLVRAGGTVTVVHRADRLDGLLAALHGRVGGIVVFPLWPDRTSRPAKRVLLRAVKGSATPLRLAAGLVLHEQGGAYSEAAEKILRHGAALPL